MFCHKTISVHVNELRSMCIFLSFAQSLWHMKRGHPCPLDTFLVLHDNTLFWHDNTYFHIITYFSDMIRQRIDKLTQCFDKITRFIDKFTWLLDKTSSLINIITYYFDMIRHYREKLKHGCIFRKGYATGEISLRSLPSRDLGRERYAVRKIWKQINIFTYFP